MRKEEREQAEAERQRETERVAQVLNLAMAKMTQGLYPCAPQHTDVCYTSLYFLNAVNEFTGHEFSLADIYQWLAGKGFEYQQLDGQLQWCFASSPFVGADSVPPLAGEADTRLAEGAEAV